MVLLSNVLHCRRKAYQFEAASLGCISPGLQDALGCEPSILKICAAWMLLLIEVAGGEKYLT